MEGRGRGEPGSHWARGGERTCRRPPLPSREAWRGEARAGPALPPSPGQASRGEGGGAGCREDTGGEKAAAAARAPAPPYVTAAAEAAERCRRRPNAPEGRTLLSGRRRRRRGHPRSAGLGLTAPVGRGGPVRPGPASPPRWARLGSFLSRGLPQTAPDLGVGAAVRERPGAAWF